VFVTVVSLQLDIEMYYREYFSESTCTIPGTLANIKASFGHPQVSLPAACLLSVRQPCPICSNVQVMADAKNYYAAYDLLKVNHCVNIFTLIDEILDAQQKPCLKQLTETEFQAVLYELYTRISLMGRWLGTEAWGKEQADDEELMQRYGSKHCDWCIGYTHPYQSPPPDELWYSTLFLAQKEATSRGHGMALVAFWKNSLGDYFLNNNVRPYFYQRA
jgi:hypothetical protein